MSTSTTKTATPTRKKPATPPPGVRRAQRRLTFARSLVEAIRETAEQSSDQVAFPTEVLAGLVERELRAVKRLLAGLA